MKFALLHPGDMGVTVGAALKHNGHDVLWCPTGRSQASLARAEGERFEPRANLGELVAAVDIVLSVCPPAEAHNVAEAVHREGFGGLYLDANAVAPSSARGIESLFGARYVDGGLIGPPPKQAGSTRLYLSGRQAEQAVGWFSGSALEAISIGAEPGAASSVKMCYAAYTKGLSALLLNVRALAEAEGVTAALLGEWQRSQPGLEERSEGSARGTAEKAWRFEGEMLEIAQTFQQAGLPGEFHLAAAEVYRRMAPLKASGGDIADVIAALTTRPV